MKKVKQYLDKNLFIINGESFCYLKDNGHYSVFGKWIYPKNYNESSLINEDHIKISINNETIIVGNMAVNNMWSEYHYFQTYKHLPKDKITTEDIIINYIDNFLQKIKGNEEIIFRKFIS